MSDHIVSASATRRTKSKLKPVKNQPALGLFIEECQKARIFKGLNKLPDIKTKKHQPTRGKDNQLEALIPKQPKRKRNQPIHWMKYKHKVL